MKKIALLFTLGLAGLAAAAQSTTTTINYDKTPKPALMLPLPYTESVTEATIVKKLKEAGYNVETSGSLLWKKQTVNGFYVFKGVALPGLNNELVDLYFKVDRKSKKEKDKSNLYMLMNKGYEKFAYPETDTAIFNAARRFLNGFESNVAATQLQVDIKAQEEAIKEAERKLAKLQGDEQDMNKKIERLQREIEETRREITKKQEQQTSQRTVIDAEKTKLEVMKARVTASR